MFRKSLSVLLAVVVIATTIPVAFAGGPMIGMTEELAVPSYDYGYGGPTSISFSIVLTSYATPDKINLTGDYSVVDAVSRIDATNKLKKALFDAKKTLGTYGNVVVVSMNVSENYPYAYGMEAASTEKTYSGYLNIRLELSNFAAVEDAKEAMMNLDFNTWTDVVVNEESKIEVESSLADQLSSLMNKKKRVYEKIIGESLGKVISLYIDTWPDGYQYDPVTGKVPVTVTASVGYALQ